MTLKEALNTAIEMSDGYCIVQDGISSAEVFIVSLESNGYCIAPMEATEEMRAAGFGRKDRSGNTFLSVYRAMIAARPKLGE